MKALTLTQPWATLVAIGEKGIETRSWGTTYRGPLAIHAAKGMPREAVETMRIPQFSRVLRSYFATHDDLPRGAVVATAMVVGCEQIASIHDVDRIMRSSRAAEYEEDFGDYSLGRYAWLLADVHALAEPVAARGSLGLWEWAASIEAQGAGQHG